MGPAHDRFGAGALILAGLLSAAATATATWLLARRATPDAAPIEATAVVTATWTCPMHPTIVSDDPGDCPICGMKLVESAAVAPAEVEGGLATVSIDPARQQLIGLRTAPVEMGRVATAWRTVGRVTVDETRVRHINVKVAGFVERVFVDFIGKPVRQGQPLFSIYSPDLVAAQEEYLLALRTRRTLGGSLAAGGDTLVDAARRKLRLWDVPESEIARLERTGEPQRTLVLRSPIGGVVVRKDVVDGMQLAAGAMPYEIVDLSKVWVQADVYESELRRVKAGMPASLALKAFPDRTFHGKVAFVAPMLEAATRTVKVRLEFPNPSGDLRPEMFGEVLLETAARQALRIPADALIHSGTRTVVFVALGEGKLAPRAVMTGDSDGQVVEVVDGLAAGEQVVTRANFLVDSESRLRASLEAMAAPPAPAPAAALGGHAGHGR
jgi:Cu(I)/Ag(I) efflux system membrane fusion protein